MPWIARILRYISKTRFRILGLATIKDIPTDQFNLIIRDLIENQWTKTYEYSGFDAWIDWGCVILQRKGNRLKFEWDNWTEGSIEGKPDILNEIAKANHLEMIHEWRWSDYDDNTDSPRKRS